MKMQLGVSKRTLGEMLINAGLVTSAQLDEALDYQLRTGESLKDALTSLNLASERDIASLVSRELHFPLFDLQNSKIDPEAVKLIPEALARRCMALPVSIDEDFLTVAMEDVEDVQAIEAMSLQAKMRVKPLVGLREEIQKGLDFNYSAWEEVGTQLQKVAVSPLQKQGEESQTAVQATDEGPVVRALDLLLSQAVKDRASDIHIEAQEYGVRVRYRIDGILHDRITLPSDVLPSLISRIKIMANMNIAERRKPQDGQFSFKASSKDIDVRVATISTIHGEMVVMRLLDKSFVFRTLPELGFLPGSLEQYERMLSMPYGIMLISGPTGSGKTTSLYASVNKLDRKERKIITIEDPVEYHFTDVNQIQVHPRAGITFASGLRSVMRLDPDVILVGEIRDSETAGIAVQSALTGHLVLSSIHANDAVSTLHRLMNLEVPPFLIATTVIGTIAQRMVRRVCPHCKVLMPAPVSEQLAYEKAMGEKLDEIWYGKGCTFCANTGFLGRMGIFEIMPMSDPIRLMLNDRASYDEIRKQAIKEGMRTMMRDGMLKVAAGDTTPNEVLHNAVTD